MIEIRNGPRLNARSTALGLLVAGALSAGPLSGCGEVGSLSVDGGTGHDPRLPPPRHQWIPTINIARASGWPDGLAPAPAEGLRVQAFATGLDHPRWIYVLPNGDVLVAETNAPDRPADGKGLRGFFMRQMMRRAGAGAASANRIVLLRDTNGQGYADFRSVLMAGLNSPFGMALVGDKLYIATTDQVLQVPYVTGETRNVASRTKVVDLPAGPINHHWTKNLIASADGRTLYVTVGSNSNAAENGIAAEEGRAAIWAVDVITGSHRIFASGLRNPNGLAWEPDSGALWVVVNERDELGNDLVPDYLTSVREGGFYGWPYSYFGSHVDDRVQPPRPDLVDGALVPDYALGSHTASLGLASAAGARLSAPFSSGMFVGQHGSWNRRPRSGYKVVFVPFTAGRPAGAPLDVLGGFLGAHGVARGRPVGVAIDSRGALLVADDVGNTIWRVTKAP